MVVAHLAMAKAARVGARVAKVVKVVLNVHHVPRVRKTVATTGVSVMQINLLITPRMTAP
jgi:hypothetical protein